MSTLRTIAEKVRAGDRVDADEALVLYREAPDGAARASSPTASARASIPSRIVTYIIDRNVNYTNVCVARCNFCAFYRPSARAEGYVLGFDELFRKIDETIAVGGVQLLLQGGHNPDLPLTWYEDLFRAIKERYPTFKLHALSPPEVIHLSRLSQLPVPEVIERLIAAGLDSIPGGGAEILVDRVRKLLHCYGKATADEWLDVMRHAHRAGLRTTATMMYGTVETTRSASSTCCGCAICRTRPAASRRSSPGATSRSTPSSAGAEATGVEYLRTLATRAHRARQLRQPAGVVGDAGRQGRAAEPGVRRQRHGQRDDRGERRARRRRELLHGRGRDRRATSRTPASSRKRRNMHYEILGDPIFREREVPRMLELATAREDGDTRVPEELSKYPARSRAGKTGRATPAPAESAR